MSSYVKKNTKMNNYIWLYYYTYVRMHWGIEETTEKGLVQVLTLDDAQKLTHR